MEPILRMENVTKAFGGNIAVKSVTAELYKGEILGMIGPNGAGKTTLFNCVAGYHKTTSGHIYLHDKEITNLDPHKICQMGIARTFQIVKPFGLLTSVENVMVGSMNHESNYANAREQAWEYIKFVGLENVANKTVGSLNIGDQRKIEMARALATKPEILLLDEIMAGLTPTESEGVMALIRKIRDSGITIYMVEHIMSAVMSLSDRIVVLVEGALAATGTPEEVSQNETVIEAYFGSDFVEESHDKEANA